MNDKQTVLSKPAVLQNSGRTEQKLQRTYTFDYSYWTAGDPKDPRYASQEVIFNDIGNAVLGHALSGYHCCVFAYGQTGSGKSYTMMGGSGHEAGLIPRICESLFDRIAKDQREASYHVEVSYLEIYNERVRDLLNPQQQQQQGANGSLRVREHPSLGPYVEDLSKAAVDSYEAVLKHMSQGNKARTVAATNMNEASSRSHAVFTIVVTRRCSIGTCSSESFEHDVTERVSRISLVDLAGSERADSTMAIGERLKEGAKINQSLAALGKVISALADRETKKHLADNKSRQKPFVPYRDSVLTWLLKDSLGGNSRTFMIATISPADYSETLSTLRYADRAKRIVNKATVNEDAASKLVRDLKAEVAQLRLRLAREESSKDLEDQLAASEKLVAELNTSWEEKLRRTQMIQAERERALAAMGISVDTNREGFGVGLYAPRDIPHLVNLSEDPLMSECLVYNIKPGKTLVGSAADVDIRLGASGGVEPTHCFFEYLSDESGSLLSVHPYPNCLVLVNGQRIEQPKQLRSGYRIIIGTSFVFRLNHPQQACQDRLLCSENAEATKDANTVEHSEYADDGDGDGDVDVDGDGDGDGADWQYAWNEAHPDIVSVPVGGGYGYYSPSVWSDSQSEISDVPETASSTAYSIINSSHHLAHLQQNPEMLCPRPSSQASQVSQASSLRRGASISSHQKNHWQHRQQRRRNSTATDISPFRSSSSFDLHQRQRGQTVSGGGLNISGVRIPRRLGAAAPAESVQNSSSPYLTDDVPDQLLYRQRLARLVLLHWRRYKLVKVGETMLRNAVHLKEANIISKELGQKVVYQFAILRGGTEGFPVSPLEPDALPSLLSDWDTIAVPSSENATSSSHAKGSTGSSMLQTKSLGHPLLNSSGGSIPEVVIKVLDIANTCWYVWSLAFFHTQLLKMRSLSTVKGSYRAHLVLDPFHMTPAPKYSCLGTAAFPLWPGERPYSVKIEAPVIDALSGLERGTVIGNLAVLPTRQITTQREKPSTWNVIVHIKSLHGVDEEEMTSVHCRIKIARASGYLNANSPITTDELAMNSNNDMQISMSADSPVLVSASSERASRYSSPLKGFGTNPVNLQFRQQWSIGMLTADTCIVIEFFGAAQPLALRRAFHEDVLIEKALQDGTRLDKDIIDKLGDSENHMEEADEHSALDSTNDGDKMQQQQQQQQLTASQNLLVERLHEEELFVDSQHEVIVWIRVLELGLDGQWEKAPCSSSGPASLTAFLLRQGLQRRVEVVVGHNASRHLQITAISKIRIGCPVLIDEKGRLVSTANTEGENSSRLMAALSIANTQMQQSLDKSSDTLEQTRLDNRCFTEAAASWDTSVFGSRLLNVPTDKSMRVRLSLEISMEMANGARPLILATDIYAQIHARQATISGSSSWLASLAESASGLLFRANRSRNSSTGANGLRSNRVSDAASVYSLDTTTTATTTTRTSETMVERNPPLGDPVFRVFAVTLSPVDHLHGKNNLWRLNTGKKYVRGEETLLPWKPRSVQFVDEFRRLENLETWRILMAQTREQLESVGMAAGIFKSTKESKREEENGGRYTPRQKQIFCDFFNGLVRLSELLNPYSGNGLGLQQEPTQDSVAKIDSNYSDEDNIRPRMAVKRIPSSVAPISMQGHFCHRGWVDVLDTNRAPDTWTTRWFVVERPYVFCFADKACRHLDNVINIASARINVDPHVSEMLGRSNILALYTNTNAYLLSPPADEVQEWISAIDEWYFMLI
ncbi:hypothetical protein LPJ64_002821 [Coemansia asiatica]|uniref:Kinesin motor domain-containing protein n=1 Tax=Coemansia asiatica TaxID=1052880 RepID=A0A9W7XKY2_9FUNG|nr:hypothetical protein LPJ64_002821 [Coemansia asiatica]